MWRVYEPKWLPVYTSQLPGEDGQEDCLADFLGRWGGRVREADWQVLVPEDQQGWVQLQLRLPALTSEHGRQRDAERQAGNRPGQALVVLKGSAAERELRDYGRRQLRT